MSAVRSFSLSFLGYSRYCFLVAFLGRDRGWAGLKPGRVQWRPDSLPYCLVGSLSSSFALFLSVSFLLLLPALTNTRLHAPFSGDGSTKLHRRRWYFKMPIGATFP
ncbi:hypothetical protein GALMADRAFT_730500 [Galerina marginata CBS 339.88]|uniref:Uncharacterized protein n=1 Tax=Galerina marginata (strain CBS 339.88) TaxID=685588 RepID=A0A067SQW5_GALM3|nr:hypothetical protein GALMADRAFT_730500 [Galerina marginata CBS 339.88]